jgi:hypothetical protein
MRDSSRRMRLPRSDAEFPERVLAGFLQNPSPPGVINGSH